MMSLVYTASPISGLEVLSCRGQKHFAKHLHEGYVLWLNSEAGEKYHLHGQNHILQPGSLSIIEPGVIHANRPCDPHQRHLRSFYFSESFVQHISGKCSGDEISTISLPTAVLDNVQIWQKFAHLHEGFLRNTDQHVLEGHILQAFAELFIALGKRPLVDRVTDNCEKRIERVIDFFHENLRRNVPLSELAELVQCSEFHLIRLFKLKKGVTPHVYQVQIRLEYAARLLKAGTAIAEAALQAGFADQSHLTRYFKGRYGITPRQYVSQHSR